MVTWISVSALPSFKPGHPLVADESSVINEALMKPDLKVRGHNIFLPFFGFALAHPLTPAQHPLHWPEAAGEVGRSAAWRSREPSFGMHARRWGPEVLGGREPREGRGLCWFALEKGPSARAPLTLPGGWKEGPLFLGGGNPALAWAGRAVAYGMHLRGNLL